MEHISKRKSSPAIISNLAENEIFVFGSNLEGLHHGGSAQTAFAKFGAQWGVGTGLAGKTYAMPTIHGGVDEIQPYVDEFIEFARLNPGLRFLVTRIGCGIAGFSDEEIAPLFESATDVENIYLPEIFLEIIDW